MNVRDQLDHERRTLARDGEQIETLADVTRLRIGAQSCVIWSRLSAATADAAIAREVAHHRALGAAFEWKVYAHDEPGDLVARLARHGFAVGACEAVMVFDLSQPASWLDEPQAGTLKRVATREQLADFAIVLAEASAGDHLAILDQLRAALAGGDDGVRGYIAYVDGQPASVGRLYTDPRSAFGGLYGGATRPAFRGRGLYRAVVAARARDALALGAGYLLVDALPTSRPILERLGFAHLTDTWPCLFTP